MVLGGGQSRHWMVVSIQAIVSGSFCQSPAAPIAPNCETSKLSSNWPSDSRERPQLKGQRRRGLTLDPGCGVSVTRTESPPPAEPPPSLPRGGGGGGRGEGEGGGGERGAGT
jgi:hypothetical protein